MVQTLIMFPKEIINRGNFFFKKKAWNGDKEGRSKVFQMKLEYLATTDGIIDMLSNVNHVYLLTKVCYLLVFPDKDVYCFLLRL